MNGFLDESYNGFVLDESYDGFVLDESYDGFILKISAYPLCWSMRKVCIGGKPKASIQEAILYFVYFRLVHACMEVIMYVSVFFLMMSIFRNVKQLLELLSWLDNTVNFQFLQFFFNV